MGFTIPLNQISSSAAPQTDPTIAQLYQATVLHVPTNGGASLYGAGDSIAQKIEFVNGVPVESYWNLSVDPNAQIPNDVFLANLLTDFIIAGSAAKKAKNSLLSNFVTVTNTPKTIAEMLVDAGLSLPLQTVDVIIVRDQLTNDPRVDVVKFATFASIIAEGQDLAGGTEFDTPQQITDNKFVVVSLNPTATAKLYIECFDAKN